MNNISSEKKVISLFAFPFHFSCLSSTS